MNEDYNFSVKTIYTKEMLYQSSDIIRKKLNFIYIMYITILFILAIVNTILKNYEHLYLNCVMIVTFIFVIIFTKKKVHKKLDLVLDSFGNTFDIAYFYDDYLIIYEETEKSKGEIKIEYNKAKLYNKGNYFFIKYNNIIYFVAKFDLTSAQINEVKGLFSCEK